MNNINIQSQVLSMSQDETLTNLVQMCHTKVESLVKNIHSKESAEVFFNKSQISVIPGEHNETTAYLHVSQSLLPKFNTRVKLAAPKFEEDPDFNNENNDGSEILDRETLKKRTFQLLNLKLKTKKDDKKAKAKDLDE